MAMFLLDNDYGVMLNYSMRAQEFVTPDRVQCFQSALLNQRITPPLNAGQFLRVRFPAELPRNDNDNASQSSTQKMIELAKGAGGSVVQWTGWTVGVLAGASYKAAVVTANAGKQAYRHIADSPVPGLVARFPGVLVGSAAAVQLWGTVMGSCVAKQALRASCIHNSLRIFNWLYLPASLRPMAVLTGVRTSQYITSGIIPGLFTAWAIYDGYRLASFAYSQYQGYYNPATPIPSDCEQLG